MDTPPPVRDRLVAVVVEKTARDALAWWKSRRLQLLDVTGARSIVEELQERYEALETAIVRYEGAPTPDNFEAMWRATVAAMTCSQDPRQESSRT